MKKRHYLKRITIALITVVVLQQILVNITFANENGEIVDIDTEETMVTNTVTNGLTYTEVGGTLTVSNYDATLNVDHPNLIIPAEDNGKLVTAINNGVFSNKGLESVVIPDSITAIPQSAFNSCGLSNVTLPNYLVTIGTSAFSNNPNLTRITIPNTVTSIQNNAFSQCGLMSVVLPPNLTTLGSYAFWKNKVSSIIIPGTVGTNGGTWGNGSFNDNLLTSVVIEEGVTSIPTDFTFDGTPPNYEDRISSLTLPSTLVTIGGGAFAKSCLPYVNLPASVTTTGSSFTFSAITAKLPYIKKLDKQVHYQLPAGMDMSKLSLNSYEANPSGWSIDVDKREIIGPQNATSLPGYTYIIGNLDGVNKVMNVSIGRGIGDQIGEVEIRFSDYDGRVIEDRVVPMNKDIRGEIPTPPVREGYLCTGWSDASYFDNIYFSHEYKAEYYACPIFNASDKTIKGGSTFNPLQGVSAKGGIRNNDLTDRIQVIENTVDTSKEGTYKVILEVTDIYHAGGLPLTSQKEYKVTVKFDKVDVRFLDYDNSVLEEIEVILNGTATPTIVPTREGYTFIGWDKSLENIAVNTDFIAQYKALPKVTTKDITIKVGDTFNPLNYIKAKDANGNTIVIDETMITNNPVDITTPGQYIVTYTIRDQWGGNVNGSFAVNVEPIMEHKILTDMNTDITIEGMFEKEGKLVIDLIPTNNNPLQEQMIGKEIVGSYEAYVIGKYEGKLSLTFPMDGKYEGKVIYIYHQKQDKSIEEFKRVVINKKITITVTELSPFILGVNHQETIIDPDKPGINPEYPIQSGQVSTGDTTQNIFGLFVGILISGVIIIKMKRKENS